MQNEVKCITVKFVCPECFGVGRIWHSREKHKGVVFSVTEKCPMCAGEGKLYVKVET